VTGDNVFIMVFNSWCPYVYVSTLPSESSGPSSLWNVISRY